MNYLFMLSYHVKGPFSQLLPHIIQLLNGREGNRKYISLEEPAIARHAAEGNGWFRGANILSVARTSSQQLFCYMTSKY